MINCFNTNIINSKEKKLFNDIIIHNIVKFLNIIDFSKLKDLGLNDNIITYDMYIKANDMIILNKNDMNIFFIKKDKKKEINLLTIIQARLYTLSLFLIKKFLNVFLLNLLIANNWEKKWINEAFKLKNVKYKYEINVQEDNEKKTTKKNIYLTSLKSTINKYNLPGVIKLLNIGIIPTMTDIKIAKLINMKEITDILDYYINQKNNINEKPKCYD